jgi:hypothetical protein
LDKSFWGTCKKELLKVENFLWGKCKIRFIFWIHFCVLVPSNHIIIFKL